jgi:hypothetical protein
MSVEVEGRAEVGVGIAEVARERVNAEVDFPARIFAPAELPACAAEGEHFLARCGLEVFDKEWIHFFRLSFQSSTVRRGEAALCCLESNVVHSMEDAMGKYQKDLFGSKAHSMGIGGFVACATN